MAVVVLMGCVEPYDPPYTDSDINFLVIDGFLDSGSETATVKISYAMPLDTNTTVNPARNAVVNVETDDGNIIPLAETAPGVYTTKSDHFQTGRTFNLAVSINSRHYLSDQVKLKASPVLDDLTWRADSRGITFYVDSHDVAGSTKYYQWNYTETWEYKANRYATLKWDGRQVVGLQADDMVDICFRTENSTKVLVTTTTSNTADVVNDFPLAFIPAGSRKLWRLFSIEVEQRAIDEQAYTYWLNLQKTTENLGGLFDQMPGEVTGNIYNAKDPFERVLGYFSGGEVQKKRIFIKRDEVPLDLLGNPGQCPDFLITPESLFSEEYANREVFIIEYIANAGYVTASPICVDCRLDGGTTTKPDFWPSR